MKLVGNLLLVISLVVGVLGAATAYEAPLALADAELTGLTLNADAGRRDDPRLEWPPPQVPPLSARSWDGKGTPGAVKGDGGQQPVKLAGARPFATAGRNGEEKSPAEVKTGPREPLAWPGDARDRQRRPLVAKGETLQPAHLQALRDQGVTSVRVREFSFYRWPGKWAFLIGLVGLGGAAVLLKRAARQQLAAGAPEGVSAGSGAPGGVSAGRSALDQLIAGVEQLQQHLPTVPTLAEQLLQTREQLDHLRQTHLEAFLEARPQLIARIGLMRYAEVMDRFAVGERQIYRAWSAAADGIRDEMVQCLEQAIACLKQARERLA